MVLVELVPDPVMEALDVDAAMVVALYPVGCTDSVLVTVTFAHVKVLVTVSVVEREDVSVMVVSLVMPPDGAVARVVGASSRATAVMMVEKRILVDEG